MPFATAADGTRIAYDADGRGGPTLVLLHGSLGDRRQWRHAGYVEAFRQIARVLSVDLRGRGESDAPRDESRYGVERHALDVLAVLHHAGAERATLWGHSLGGRVAFELAAHHPGRVEAVIATGASGMGYSPYAAVLRDSARAIEQAGLAATARAASANLPMPEWMIENWSQGDAAAIAASVRANAAWAGADGAMSAMAVPVLLLVGEADPVLEQARATAAAVPRCVLVELEGADHITSFTGSDVPCALALEFLRDLWVPGGAEALSPGGDNAVEK